jgi:hypothetical protein
MQTVKRRPAREAIKHLAISSAKAEEENSVDKQFINPGVEHGLYGESRQSSAARTIAMLEKKRSNRKCSMALVGLIANC